MQLKIHIWKTKYAFKIDDKRTEYIKINQEYDKGVH